MSESARPLWKVRSGRAERTSEADEGAMIYPGDPDWPYTTPGVCDTVRDGRVVSTRELQPQLRRATARGR